MVFVAAAALLILAQSGDLQVLESGRKDAGLTVLLLGPAKLVEDEFRFAVKSPLHVLALPLAAPLALPPQGKAYRDNPAEHFVWRTLATRRVDLVLTNEPGIQGQVIAGYGTIPAEPLRPGSLALLRARIPRSPAHLEFDRRMARSPKQLASLLQKVYGQEFAEPLYQPGMSLIARLRMGETDAVRNLAMPYAENSRDSLKNATGSHLAGHLVFAELAERLPAEPAWTKLVRRAAELGFIDEGGSMREAMPFHNEMSDATFMSCPLLAKAGKLTGDRKYFDMLLRHFRFVQNLCLRSDGLYRHSPLSEAAWGRGNAFPLLGLALSLQDLPKDHPAYGELLSAYRTLARALAPYQDQSSGMWRQLIDNPKSYTEFSATAMIGRALVLGIRNGWLPRNEFEASVNAAWKAIAARTSDNGEVLDVCESTGKQKSAEEYLRREAIHGRDARGGGMAFLFAVELMDLR